MAADMIVKDGKVGVRIEEKLSTLTVKGNPSFNLTGTVAKTATSKTLTGTGTVFLSEVGIGDQLLVDGGGDIDFLYVVSIESDTELTTDFTANNTASGETAVCNPSIFRLDTEEFATQVVADFRGQVSIGAATPRVEGFSEETHLHIRTRGSGFPSVILSNSDSPGAIALRIFGDEEPIVDQDLLFFSPLQDRNLLTLSSNSGVVVETGLCLRSQLTVDANTTLDRLTTVVHADAGVGGVTLTLPSSATNFDARLYQIFKIAGAGDVTVAPDGAELINGVNASKDISTQWAGLQLLASEEHGWIATVLTPA